MPRDSINDALVTAIESDDPELIKQAIQARKNQQRCSDLEAVNLHFPATRYHKNVAQDPNWYDSTTPLYMAACLGKLNACKTLIELGAEPYILNLVIPDKHSADTRHSKRASLIGAVGDGHLEIVKYFVEIIKMPVSFMPEKITTREAGCSPLYIAAVSKIPRQKKKEIISYLISHGANIYAQFNDDSTFLTELASNNFGALRELDAIMSELEMPLDYLKQTAYTKYPNALDVTRTVVGDACKKINIPLLEYLVKEKKIDLWQGNRIAFIAEEVLRVGGNNKVGIEALQLIVKILPTSVNREFTVAGRPVRQPTTILKVLQQVAPHMLLPGQPLELDFFRTLQFPSIYKHLASLPVLEAFNNKDGFILLLATKFNEYYPHISQPSFSIHTLNMLIWILTKLSPQKRFDFLMAIDTNHLTTILKPNINALKKVRALITSSQFEQLLKKINITQEQYFVMDPQSTHSGAVHKIVNESAYRLMYRYRNINVREILLELRTRILELAHIPIPQGLGLNEERLKIIVECLDRVNLIRDKITIRTNNTTGADTQLSVAQLLALVYAAIKDGNPAVRVKDAEPLTNDEILARLRTLCTQLIEVQTEYQQRGPACYSGLFNKVVDTIQGTHIDVPYIVTDKILEEEQILRFSNVQDKFFDLVFSFFKEVDPALQTEILKDWDDVAIKPNTHAGKFATELTQRIQQKYPYLLPENIEALIANLPYIPLRELHQETSIAPMVDEPLPTLGTSVDKKHASESIDESDSNNPAKRQRSDAQILSRSMGDILKPSKNSSDDESSAQDKNNQGQSTLGR